MNNTTTAAAEYFQNVILPLRLEAQALLGHRPTEATARRIHECGLNSYAHSHCEARDYSRYYGVTCYVVRQSARAIELNPFHPFTHVEVVQPGMEVLAVYEAGQRTIQGRCPSEMECAICNTVWAPEVTDCDECPNCQELEEAEQAAAAETDAEAAFEAQMNEFETDLADEEIALVQEMLEEAAAAAQLRYEWEQGITSTPTLRLVALMPAGQPVARPKYYQSRGADNAAWLLNNGLLWEALRKAGMSHDASLRHEGASALLGFDVSSYRQLSPGELLTVRLAVEAGLFFSNWTLRVRLAARAA